MAKTASVTHMEAGLAFEADRPAGKKRPAAAYIDREMFGLIRDYGAFEGREYPHYSASNKRPGWVMTVYDPALVDPETGKRERWVTAKGATFQGCITNLKRAIRRQQKKEYRER